jgi:hypothetical protein
MILVAFFLIAYASAQVMYGGKVINNSYINIYLKKKLKIRK